MKELELEYWEAAGREVEEKMSIILGTEDHPIIPSPTSLHYSISKLIKSLEAYLNSEHCEEDQEGPIAWTINDLYRLKDEVIK